MLFLSHNSSQRSAVLTSTRSRVIALFQGRGGKFLVNASRSFNFCTRINLYLVCTSDVRQSTKPVRPVNKKHD